MRRATAARARRLGWAPYANVRGRFRGVLVSLSAAVFLSLAGAFGSAAASLPVRLAYWVALMLLGYAWGSLVARFVLTRLKGITQNWLRVIVVAVILAIPFTAVAGAASALAFHAHFTLAALPGLGLSVLILSLAMTALNVLIETRREALAQVAPAPAKFLDRLPLQLRGAEVWAVEAEDHYLRLHTSKGQDLILMRLADAVAELEGVEGAQVHRSWWVARAAIAGARRGDGRATLTLKDGAEVPVSRTYAGLLRERGWI